MKFSTKTTYGLRAMINLAKTDSSESVSIKSIAKREDISVKYLERIFSQFKKAGIVKSKKGSLGGYSLAKTAGKINVHDIIEALEGSQSSFYCLDSEGKVYCAVNCHCPSISGLKKIETDINNTLKNIKLSDLIIR